MGVVGEGGGGAEERAKHRRCRAGLHRVARGVFGEVGGVHERGHPVAVDAALDGGHGAQQVDAVLGFPRGDEGIGHGDVEPRVGLCGRP